MFAELNSVAMFRKKELNLYSSYVSSVLNFRVCSFKKITGEVMIDLLRVLKSEWKVTILMHYCCHEQFK